MLRALLLLFILVSIGILGLVHPKVVFAACNPPSDYSSCSVGFYGDHVAGNLIGPDNKTASVARANFEYLRTEANSADQSYTRQQIPVTAIFSPTLIRDPAAMADVFAAAKQYGIQLNISLDVSPAEAAEVGGKLSTGLSLAGVAGNTRVEIMNESNINGLSGSQYGAILSQFASTCTSCQLYLAALGGPPIPEITANQNAFALDFAKNYPALFDRINGIAFNSYGTTPQAAATQWLTALNSWTVAAATVGKNISGKSYFLTEVGPPDGNPDYNYPGGTQAFLVDVAKYISSSTDPAFKKLQGLTWFLWEGDGSRMVLVFVDRNSIVDRIKKQPVLTGWNLGTNPRSTNKRTEPNYGLPEESAVDCPPEEGAGGSNGVPTYRPPVGASRPEMRSDAGLNFGSGGVRGTHCGQAKSDPIVLKEQTRYPPPAESECKVLSWTGEITINNDQGINIPFVQQLGDHFAGTWDIDHASETEMDQKQKIANGEGVYTLDEQAAAIQEIDARQGVLKKLLPMNKQDELKCNFIQYVKRKGQSMYHGETVDGARLTDIPCPPYLTNPNVSVQEEADWNTQWSGRWSRLSLYPNERSVGKISFSVCADKTYNTYSSYPEVFRLGLATNDLFQIFNPEAALNKFYTGTYADMRKPLTSTKLLGLQPGESEENLAQAPSQEVTQDISPYAEAFEAAPPQETRSFMSVLQSIVPKVGQVLAYGAGSLLAQSDERVTYTGPVLQGNVEILPGPGFNYAVTVSKTPYGWEQFPGVIGDVQVGFEGGGIHIQNLFSDLRFDTTHSVTAGFLPRFSSEQELRDALARGQIYFRADMVDGLKRAFSLLGGVIAGPPACNTDRSCCGSETRTCTPSCAICSRAQAGPSDTSGSFSSEDARRIGLGDPKIGWNFTAEGWDGNAQNLPPGCDLELDEEGVLHAVCTKEHDRVVDVHNFVPFLGSIWDQSAGSTGKAMGFFNAFRTATSKGSGLSTGYGCTDSEQVVFDKNGNFVPNPGSTTVSYGFKQFSSEPEGKVKVTLVDGEDKKLLFYRIGGVCNADQFVSGKVLMPSGEINTFFNPGGNTNTTPTPSPTP